jgi:hypothetical protein
MSSATFRIFVRLLFAVCALIFAHSLGIFLTPLAPLVAQLFMVPLPMPPLPRTPGGIISSNLFRPAGRLAAKTVVAHFKFFVGGRPLAAPLKAETAKRWLWWLDAAIIHFLPSGS